MDLKKKIKGFFTLTRKGNGGFTLVELIVVIAILAILGGVAVPAYGGYIKKANKQADITLISEVADALMLYYYSNSGEAANGFVILNQEGVPYAEHTHYNAAGDAAMTAVFGEDWKNTVFLKHDGWTGVSSTLSYKESSYCGQESGLIQTVDKLTGALGDVVTVEGNGNNLIGGEFESFLNDNKVDTNNGKAIGNAAVLYVAKKTQGNEDAIKTAFANGLAAAGNPVNNVFAELTKPEIGLGEAAALAAIYAYAEGYAQETGRADDFHTATDFSTVTDANSALTALGNAFSVLDPNGLDAYKADQGIKDLQAYIDMMGTVHENSNIVSGNLNSPDCFTDGTVENMLKGHAEMSDLGITTQNGQAAVVLVVDADGSVMACVAPPNYNK